jgi:hypothetical protein
MSYVLEMNQNGVEVTVGAEMTEEFLCDITKDTCDVVCSHLHIVFYTWKIS